MNSPSAEQCWTRIVSNAKKMSEDDPPNAKFDPHVLGMPSDIVQLEISCIDDGIPLTDLNDESANQHKFYLDCRKHFKNPNYIVGYCSGEKTHTYLSNGSHPVVFTDNQRPRRTSEQSE